MEQGEDRERMTRDAEFEDWARRLLTCGRDTPDRTKTGGHWSEQPPENPGFYWAKIPTSWPGRSGRIELGEPEIVRFTSGVFFATGEDIGAFPSGDQGGACATVQGWLFWSERIDPPPAS